MRKTAFLISALMTCTLLTACGTYASDNVSADYGQIENDFTDMTPEIARAYLSVIDELAGHLGCDAAEDAADECLHGGFVRDWDADGTPELCLLLRTSPRENDSWDGTPVYGWYPPTLYLYTYQDEQAVRAGVCDLYFGTAGREAAVIALMTEDGMKYVWWDLFAPEKDKTVNCFELADGELRKIEAPAFVADAAGESFSSEEFLEMLNSANDSKAQLLLVNNSGDAKIEGDANILQLREAIASRQ